MDKKLKGKVALVTGGSRGIGAATAKLLAELGASVVITYEKSESHAKEVVDHIISSGGKGFAMRADASETRTAKIIIERINKEFGQLDILVNNAGIFEGIGQKIGTVPLEVFDRTLKINVSFVFELTQEAVKVMSSGGRIINVSSVLGERAIFAGAGHYTMSKHAVSGFTRGWAWDLADREITVNAVIPGPIDTGMGDPSAASLSALKRLGKPSEVAAVIGFLASGDASYVTGATIRVDGGVNA